MARRFFSPDDEYLYTTQPLTAAPFTMSCWFNIADNNTGRSMLSIGDSDGAQNHGWALRCDGSVAGDPLKFVVFVGGSATVSANTTTGFTANKWHHGCGVEISASSRKVYIDGGSVGSETSSRTPLNVDQLRVSSNAISSFTNEWNGRLAEAAVWNIDLTPDEITLLADGYCPLFIRPQYLVFYDPLITNNLREIARGRTIIDETVSPRFAEHPGIIYPSDLQLGMRLPFIQSTPPITGNPWYAYQQM